MLHKDLVELFRHPAVKTSETCLKVGHGDVELGRG